MCIQGIGIDIVDLARIRSAPDKARLAEYVLLPEELREYQKATDKTEYLGSRFAAKEAVIKAVPEEIGYRDIMVHKQGAKPKVSLSEKCTEEYVINLSIAHERDTAVCVAVAC